MVACAPHSPLYPGPEIACKTNAGDEHGSPASSYCCQLSSDGRCEEWCIPEYKWDCAPGTCAYEYNIIPGFACKQPDKPTAVYLTADEKARGTQKGGAWNAGMCKKGDIWFQSGSDNWCCGANDTDCLKELPGKFYLKTCS